MAQRTGGPRRKTRSALKKNVRLRGKMSIRKYLQEFKAGDKVAFVAEPTVQGGMHHRRFQGEIGVVIGQQGDAYKIKIIDGNMEKLLIVHPIHLRRH